MFTGQKMKRFREVMPPLERFNMKLLIPLGVTLLLGYVLIEISRRRPSIGEMGLYSKTLFNLGGILFLVALAMGHIVLWQAFWKEHEFIPFMKGLGKDIKDILPVIPLYTFFLFLMFLTLIFLADGGGWWVALRTLLAFAAIIFVWRKVYVRRKRRGIHHQNLGITVLVLLLWILTIAIFYFMGRSALRLVMDYADGPQTAYVSFVTVEDYPRERDTYTVIFEEAGIENPVSDAETNGIDAPEENRQIIVNVREPELDAFFEIIEEVPEGVMTYYAHSGIFVQIEK